MTELEQSDDETVATSRGYIQYWMPGERLLEEAIRQIFTATDRIIQAGRFAIEQTGAFEPVPTVG